MVTPASAAAEEITEVQQPSSRIQPRDERRANAPEMALFYVVGLGTSLGTQAVLSCLVFYTASLGLNSFVYLYLASFAPMLPLTILQAHYDTGMERRFGSSSGVFKFRGHVGFAVAVASLCAMPFASNDLAMLSLATTLLGAASSVLYGSLQQMASFVYRSCGRLPAALTTGFQSSALLVLVVSLSTGFGSSGSSAGIYPFYFVIMALVFLSWVCFHVLMHYSRDVTDSMSNRDSSLKTEPISNSGGRQTSTVNDEQEGNQALCYPDSQTGEPPAQWRIGRDPETGKDTLMKSAATLRGDREDVTYRYLWSKSWPSCMTLIINIVSSTMIASWLNRVQSANDNNTSFPQVLFYIKNIGDALGRPFTLLVWSRPIGGRHEARFLRRIGIFATLQAFIFVPLFFVYVSAPDELLPRNDVAVMLFLGIFAFSVGAINTTVYQRAPYLVMDCPETGAMQTEQTKLLNICMSVGLLLGIFINLGLQEGQKI